MDQRGRRRPSREYHASSSSQQAEHKPMRRNDHERSAEEPHPKHLKTASGLRAKPSTSSGGDERQCHGSSSLDSTLQPSVKCEVSEAAPTISAVSKMRAGGSRTGDGGSRTGDGGRAINRFDIVHTRPAEVTSKSGTTGRPVKLQTNYFRLMTKPTWSIFKYHVSFKPEIESKRMRGGILSQHRAALGVFLYDGMQLFATKKLAQEKTIIDATSRMGEEYVITIRAVGVISMTESESLQILNLIMRRSMEGLKLQMVGRNFFDALAKIDLREFRLQLWPGYQTSIRQHEDSIMMCAEIAHKVMRTETLYDILKKCTETARDFQEDFRRNVLGMTVLTDYNNKTYCISDVDFTKNPQMTFKCKEKEISFIDYYYSRYNLRIRDVNQPLLLTKAKQQSVRAGQSDNLILIPELCRATGLTDSMRSNFQLMRSMADHTRMSPDRRIQRLLAFNSRLVNTEASMKVLNDWNMKLSTELVQLDGRVFEPERICFADRKKVSSGPQADWTRMFRDNGMFTTPSCGLQRWAIIGPTNKTRELRQFIEALMRAAAGMNFRIDRPKEVLLYDDRNHSYMQAIEECCNQDPQLIFCLVPNNNADRYSSIKKKSYLERGVPTQVVTLRTVTNQRSLMSVATNVAIQINCKLGYTPWMIDLPLSGLMTIGYDVVKSSRDASKAYGALVATMDMKTNATFYSTITECSAHDALANSLWPMMTKALRQYRMEHNNQLPTRILFYRDGVGDGSLRQVYEYEVKDIVERLKLEYQRAKIEQPPMFAYVIVSKSLNTRFFAHGRNPSPGTVVDSVITLPERYDFYLVSQSVRQGTVSPTSYNVLYSNIKLTPDKMQLLTYKMTHLYFNWSGTTRVPAVCQYAKKLATLVATALYMPPLNSLEKKLYYL